MPGPQCSRLQNTLTGWAVVKFPVFSLCFPCVAEIFPVFFIEELTVIVIKEMSLAPSYTIYFLLKPYTA